MNTRSMFLVVVATASCHASHGRDVDASEDGSGDGAVTTFDRIGPRCEPAPAPACVDVVATMTLPRRAPFARVVAVSATDSGGHVLWYEGRDDGRSHDWWVAAFDEAGASAGEPVHLEQVPQPPRGGDVVSRDPAHAVVAWRAAIRDADGAHIAVETHLASVEGGTVALEMPRHRDMGRALAGLHMIAADDRLTFVRGISDGIAVDGDAWEPTVLPADPRGRFETHRVGDTVVVAFNESAGPGAARTSIATTSGPDSTRSARVFDLPLLRESAPLALTRTGDHVLVARFEPTPDDLRAGRLRIAELDDRLERVSVDRGFDGWGGFTPLELAMVDWAGQPWIVWETIDERFGVNVTLYVARLPTEACLAAVDAPVGVLHEAASTDPGGLALAATDDALWIARSSRREPVVEVHRAVRCD